MIRRLALALATTAGLAVSSAAAQSVAGLPPPLANGKTAIERSVDGLCPWYFGAGKGVAAEQVRDTARAGGFYGVSGEDILFPAEPGQAGAPIAVRAAVQEETERSSVLVFLQAAYPVCQIQVHGYFDDVEAFAGAVEKAGWTRVGKTVVNGDLWSDRFIKGPGGPTLVVNRVFGGTGNDLSMVVNYFPGKEDKRGELN